MLSYIVQLFLTVFKNMKLIVVPEILPVEHHGHQICKMRNRQFSTQIISLTVSTYNALIQIWQIA